MSTEIIYQIALKNLEGIGPQRARLLVDHFGSVEALFNAPATELKQLSGMARNLLNRKRLDSALSSAEEELDILVKHDIQPYFFKDSNYPNRLKHCGDAPVMIFGKGNLEMNTRKSVAIIGTRDCTDYGARLTERLVADLSSHDVLVVSGLAYGVDTIAHKAAVKNGLQTIGVLGSGLDRIYPSANKGLVEQMKQHGGILSEFELGTKPDRENFPQRNRIVAGMADVTVVIESGVKGGSMITARLANSYNRDVVAFPGSVDAPQSSGCNHLIKSNQAALIESADDLVNLMGWYEPERKSAPQKQMFADLNTEEQIILKALSAEDQQTIDNLSLKCGWPTSKTSTMLLELEFKGVVRALPGKVYART